VTESAPHNEPDVHKRRSTRIVQAVPITVTGVDALGRPFQERTSTLLINCHGCRYQSKHYILKNMWVTLEVPHPEPGQGPREARALVTWIQRPRTVRELFQIGVELENPGNIWGIAFPPADWFPAPDPGEPAVPLPAADAAAPEQPPAPEWTTPGAAPLAADNVVVMGAGGDAPLQLARQVARLVVEAKQQIHAAVREATSKAVTQEVKQLVSSLESQLKSAANRAAQDAANLHAEHWLEHAGERMELQTRASVESLRTELARDADARLEEARTLLAARMESVQLAEQENFKTALNMSVEAAMDRLRHAAESAAARTEQGAEQFERSRQQLRAAVEEAARRWEQELAARSPAAPAEQEDRVEEISTKIQHAIDEGEQQWRARMESQLAEAQQSAATRAAEATEQAIQQASARISGQVREGAEQLQAQADNQMAALRRHAEFLYAQATQSLGEFRNEWQREAERSHAAFTEIEMSAARVTEAAEHIDDVRSDAIARIEESSRETLDWATARLKEQSDAAVSGMSERLRPVLDDAGTQAAQRLSEVLAQELAPQLNRAAELAGKLAASQTAADEALREHHKKLRRASEEHAQQTAQRQQETSAQLEKEWNDSARATIAKWLEELDARATDITHTTVESLYKSSNWYEKKVQTQMQAALDKGVEQSSEALRTRAGELSAMFGSELDRYSRSFVDHAREELAESAKNSVAQTQQGVREIVESANEEAGAKARQTARVELERFNAGLRNAFDQAQSHLEMNIAQLRARLSTESREFVAEYQKHLQLQARESLAQAAQDFNALKAAFIQSAETARAGHEKKMDAALSRASDDAMETYKSRMENAANAWLLSSAAKLNQQAESHVEEFARSAETRLRETFSQVLAGIGDTLRQRLANVSIATPAPLAPPAPKDTSGM
jgi:hypothetical protein